MGFKSDKDREAFVQKLTDAGFAPEEIDAEISSIEKSTPPPAPVVPPAIKPSSKMGGGTADESVAPPLAPATPAQVQTKAADLSAAREAAGNTLADQAFNSDTAKMLLYPAAAYGVYKGAQALKDRMFTPQIPQYPTGPEPTMGAEPALPDNKLPPAAQQKAYTPKEAAVAGNITEKYPFSLEEAKKGLGIPDVKITNPTDAELVAKQYSNQLKAAGYVSNLANNTPPPAPDNSPASATTATSEKLPAVNKSVPPPGMREQYAKGKKNPIGPGGYNWVAGQEGPERAPATWKDLFGEKNVPYAEAMQKFREFELTGQEPGRGLNEIPRSAMGGSHKTPKYIPEYIKGGATLGGMGGAAGLALAPFLIKPSIEAAIQSGKEGDTGMAASHLSNLLNLHPFGMAANMLFGNSPEELQTLREAEQRKKVGAGRGIAPPSAYQR